MEQNYFIIAMLCKDNEQYYIDNISKLFDNLEEAKNEMFKYATSEFHSLADCGSFEIVNLANSLNIYDENKELVTSYEILTVRK